MAVVIAVAMVILGVIMLVGKPNKQIQNQKSMGILLILASLGVILYKSIVVVPAGHVGVVDFFGIVSKTSLKPGINLVNPFAKVEKMSVKTQEIKEVATVPTKEGLSISLEVSVLYHLDAAKAPDVYKTVGPVYSDIILAPQFRSVIRTVTAGYEAKALYTSVREKLAQGIADDLKKIVESRGITIENVPLRNIQLPQKVSEAIEEKLRAEQESERMQFILQKEKLEAERKRIEGQGIADFQKIVSEGLNKELLQWKGIEATEKLSTSANSKIVVVGGKDGLPLILNTEK